MAWTYFTTELSEGDYLTHDQRNELMDAYRERLEAAGELLSDETEFDTIKASRQVTDRIPSSERSQGQPMGASIGSLAADHYHREDTGSSGSAFYVPFHRTSSNSGYILRWVAKNRLSLTDAKYEELAPTLHGSAIARQDNHHHWNILWWALKEMKWLDAELTDKELYLRNSGTGDASWSDAKTNFLGNTESLFEGGMRFNLTGNYDTSDEEYDISGDRSEATLSPPAHSVFSSYEVGLEISFNTGSEIPPDNNPSVDVNPGDGVQEIEKTHNVRIVKSVGLISGTSLSCKPRGYDDSGELENYKPDTVSNLPSEDTNRVFAGSISVFIRPNFTH